MNIKMSKLENTIRDSCCSTVAGDLVQESQHELCMLYSTKFINSVWRHLDGMSFSNVKLNIYRKYQYQLPPIQIPKRFCKPVLKELQK